MEVKGDVIQCLRCRARIPLLDRRIAWTSFVISCLLISSSLLSRSYTHSFFPTLASSFRSSLLNPSTQERKASENIRATPVVFLLDSLSRAVVAAPLSPDGNKWLPRDRDAAVSLDPREDKGRERPLCFRSSSRSSSPSFLFALRFFALAFVSRLSSLPLLSRGYRGKKLPPTSESALILATG